MRPRASEAGFSLLELIVATAILGTAIVGLLSLITLTLGNAARVAEYDRAAMMARTQVNELRLLDPLPLGAPLAGELGDGWAWTAEARPFHYPGVPAAGAEMLVRIELVLRWNGIDGATEQLFEGYRRMPIRPEHMGLFGS